MIEFILKYWVHILIAILFLVGLVLFIINERKNIKEWLLYAVIQAEKELGGRTGKIKLRQVYDMFIVKYPIISKLMPFDYFSKLVDYALIEMKKLLATNCRANIYIKGDDNK